MVTVGWWSLLEVPDTFVKYLDPALVSPEWVPYCPSSRTAVQLYWFTELKLRHREFTVCQFSYQHAKALPPSHPMAACDQQQWQHWHSGFRFRAVMKLESKSPDFPRRHKVFLGCVTLTRRKTQNYKCSVASQKNRTRSSASGAHQIVLSASACWEHSDNFSLKSILSITHIELQQSHLLQSNLHTAFLKKASSLEIFCNNFSPLSRQGRPGWLGYISQIQWDLGTTEAKRSLTDHSRSNLSVQEPMTLLSQKWTPEPAPPHGSTEFKPQGHQGNSEFTF